MSFYAEPDSYSKNKIKIESHFPNYATKSEVKKAAGVDTLEFAKKG